MTDSVNPASDVEAPRPEISGGEPSQAPSPAAEKPAPRRRGRKPKAAAEDAVEAAPATGDEPASKPAKRATRARRSSKAATESEAQAKGQAEGEPVSDKAPEKPKTRRRTAKKADAAGAADAEVAPEVAAARALAQVPQASVARRSAKAAAADASSETPAEKPRRRGRKPKAVDTAAADASATASAAETAAPAAEATAPAADAPAEDRRADEGAKPEQAEKPEKAEKAARAPREHVAADEGKRSRSRRDDRDKHAHGKDNRPGRGADNRSRANDRNDRGDRGNRRDRNKRGRFAQTEPTLSREDCAAMKVAELRAKAAELEIEYVGLKKAELVEAVYAAAARAEGFRDIEGILDLTNEGFGYIRAHGYLPSKDDAFVPANMVRAAGLRAGDYIAGTLRPARPGDKFPGLTKLKSVNGLDPEESRRRPKFSELTPIYPNERLKMEHGKDSITGRAIDIVSPVGKGQRGLIVSPPKAGKTTVLKRICQAIAVNNPEVHLICLLVDERPEEVTDMQRSIHGEVVASTFDMPADNHTRVAELVIERAKRLAEMGGDVVVVLDSSTRLARAYNLSAPASGRILSGGVDSAALYPPKRFLGAARNIENGGSLTILASALVDTGSKMDEVIFEEFKGTGNMELKLDRDLADRRIFPAIDPVASGTRNEDLLIDGTMLPFVQGIRRVLANMSNTERAAASFIKGLRSTASNEEFLIRTAKKAADYAETL